MHAAVRFSLSTVTVSAESVDGSTPAVRVTWNTTAPSECVAAARVEFITDILGPVVASYTATNTSGIVVIQTGLQCVTNYYIRVVITGATSHGLVSSNSVEVLIGGKEIQYCVHVLIQLNNLMVVLSLHRHTSPSWSES